MTKARRTIGCGKVLPQTLGERILDRLRQDAPEEYNAKTLAALLKAEPSSVRKELSRLMQREPPVIVRAHKGFYRATVNVESLRRQIMGQPVLLHGLKLEGLCLNSNTKLCFAAMSETKKSYRRRSYYRWAWEGRTVSVTLHESGFTELWLNTSANPLDYPAFGRFRSWMEGRIPEAVGEWKLKQVDIHVDMREFQVSDFKGLRLKVFDNAWFHLYQKTSDILRLEVSMVPRDLHFREAVAIIAELVKVPTKDTYESSEPPDDLAYR